MTTPPEQPPIDILIVGWNPNGARLLTDLLSTDPEARIAILSSGPIEAPLPPLPDAPRLTHQLTQPRQPTPFSELPITESTAAVLLADRTHPGSDTTLDARTFLTAMALRSSHAGCYIIAELLDETNLSLTDDVGIDHCVLPEHFTGAMLAQVTQHRGLSTFFDDLFRAGSGVQFREITWEELDLPPLSDSPRFDALASQVMDHTNLALLGIRRDTQLFLPPAPTLPIHSTDHLIVVAPQ